MFDYRNEEDDGVKYASIYISREEADEIGHWLNDEPECEDDCLPEDVTITKTARFDDGMEMEVKCCGVKYEEGYSNVAWTEAVLFQGAGEVACSEPSDEFLGEWRLECDGIEYVTFVQVRDKKAAA